MKKLLTFAALLAVVALTSCKYDDDDIWNSVHGLENRVAKLEELCKQMNTNISSLQTIVTALQNNDYITNVTPIMKEGEIVGYTISFAKSNAITIYNGKDGKDGIDGSDGKNGEDGKNGITPTIGVKQDADGVYYWTLNGDWLTDENGDKIKAEGTDGKDGADGSDGNNGSDGANGQNGITPQFKIENNYWYISYDNEKSWIQLGRATGENGKDGMDGTDGKDGDNIFKTVTQDDTNVYFTLNDNTIITIPKATKYDVSFDIDCKSEELFEYGETRIFTVIANNVYDTSISTPIGWKASLEDSNLIVTALSYNNSGDTKGVISIIIVDNNGKTIIRKMVVNIASNFVTIPDANFQEYCLTNFDSNKDGVLSKSEAQEVVSINCEDLNIQSLDGIACFTNLTTLTCRNNRIEKLDLSGCVNLEELICFGNKLNSLEITNCTKLTYISCSDNLLVNLNLENCSSLKQVHCPKNNISNIIISQNLSFSPSSNNFVQIDKDIESIVYQDGKKATYSIGDYNNGIVFSINGNGETGKTMYIDRTSTVPRSFIWAENLGTTQVGTTDLDDGMINMQIIRAIEGWKDIFPAFAFCAKQGDNWYLPAKNELTLLYSNKDIINESLKALDRGLIFAGDRYNDPAYWSSTESSSSVYAYQLNGSYILNAISKTSSANTLAISKF